MESKIINLLNHKKKKKKNNQTRFVRLPGNERLTFPTLSFCYSVFAGKLRKQPCSIVRISFVNYQSQVNAKKNRLEGEAG